MSIERKNVRERATKFSGATEKETNDIEMMLKYYGMSAVCGLERELDEASRLHKLKLAYTLTK